MSGVQHQIIQIAIGCRHLQPIGAGRNVLGDYYHGFAMRRNAARDLRPARVRRKVLDGLTAHDTNEVSAEIASDPFDLFAVDLHRNPNAVPHLAAMIRSGLPCQIARNREVSYFLRRRTAREAMPGKYFFRQTSQR